MLSHDDAIWGYLKLSKLNPTPINRKLNKHNTIYEQIINKT